jgi:hypothetical protein
MKKLIISYIVFLFAFNAFSQKITFQLKEKRIHYTDISGNDAKLTNITEPTCSTLTFNIKDSTMTLQKNGETSITKLSKISKKGHQYFFESVGNYAIDQSKSVITYYMIDCKKQVGTEKYASFCMPNLIHVTDFKGCVLTR